MRYAACPVCLDEPPVPRRRASHGTKGARARAAVKFFVNSQSKFHSRKTVEFTLINDGN